MNVRQEASPYLKAWQVLPRPSAPFIVPKTIHSLSTSEAALTGVDHSPHSRLRGRL